MTKSQNGWPASKDEKKIGIKVFKIKGTDRKMRLQKDAGVILTAFAAEFHAQVEPIDEGVFDDWAYAYRDVKGSNSVLSNHSSGSAIDLNATKHPLGMRDTFTKQQAVIIRELCKKYGIRWGEDYKGRIDSMHFEIIETPEQVKQRIKDMGLKPTKEKKMAKATIKKTNKEKALAAVESWARASLAAVAALYVSGITDPKILLNAFLAGLLGPLVKALQPNQKDYGINSK